MASAGTRCGRQQRIHRAGELLLPNASLTRVEPRILNNHIRVIAHFWLRDRCFTGRKCRYCRSHNGMSCSPYQPVLFHFITGMNSSYPYSENCTGCSIDFALATFMCKTLTDLDCCHQLRSHQTFTHVVPLTRTSCVTCHVRPNIWLPARLQSDRNNACFERLLNAHMFDRGCGGI